MDCEIFVNVAELGDRYQISNYGAIYSNKYKRLIKPVDNGNGYLTLYAQSVKGDKMYYIHRLVAKYFIVNPLNKKYVNHKDGDKANNRADNLEWVTARENQLHRVHVLKKGGGVLVGLHGKANGRAKLNTDEKINGVFAMLKAGSMIKEIAAAYSVNVSTISRLVNLHSHKK